MPLGYEVTIFEKLPRPGGLMRINIPAFRLPEQVLDEEIGYIVDMGVDVRYNTPVDSLKALLDSGEFDAVFVGSGAPKGKELDIPGRHDTDQIFIGIEWLESIHFGHVDSVGKRVLIIGVGNTAMDCCRSAKRLGATDVKVIARKTRKYFKASPWELEDAEEEGVEILENLQPVRFVIENGMLTGMEFDKFKSVETDKRAEAGSRSAARSSRATPSCWRSARTTRFRSSSATSGSSSASGTCRSSTRRRSCRRGRACSSAATRRSARRTSSGRSSTATRRRSRSTTTARACRSPSGRRRA